MPSWASAYSAAPRLRSLRSAINSVGTPTRSRGTTQPLPSSEYSSRAVTIPACKPARREALLDPESAVRSKAALILYLVKDTESITSLGDLLYDDEIVVAAASATALAGLGADESYTGATARLMVASLEKVRPSHRVRILHELKRLHGSDLGEDSKPWRDWGLPTSLAVRRGRPLRSVRRAPHSLILRASVRRAEPTC